MSNAAINIGDRFNTEAFGVVIVADVYISPSTQERVYRVLSVGTDQEYLVTGAELTQ